ncbi:hypothetical protein SELMODRAFT_409268 [Selaginella moellendorffii]|uniref:F-box domain-containing protein n=1 Tax=Selaginella moellendorffii TaxID=88036 RepID=D8RAX4_SELML|nr:hypothetical protein SELMODRAFT_409268 [Selaginella moellendorffii]
MAFGSGWLWKLQREFSATHLKIEMRKNRLTEWHRERVDCIGHDRVQVNAVVAVQDISVYVLLLWNIGGALEFHASARLHAVARTEMVLVARVISSEAKDVCYAELGYRSISKLSCCGDMDMDAQHTTMNEKQTSRLWRPVAVLPRHRGRGDGIASADKWKKLVQKHSADSKWQDIPMELLVRILALVDHRTVLWPLACAPASKMPCLLASWSFHSLGVRRAVAYKFYCVQSCNLRRCTLSLVLGLVEREVERSLVALANGCQKLDLSGCIGISGARLLNLCGCDNAGSDNALKGSVRQNH